MIQQASSFIHTSDLHLNGQEERYRVLSKITLLCLEKKVDALLIAGDLFADSNPSLEIQRFIVEQFKMLNRNNIHVFLIAGDHDADLATNKSFMRKLPKNVIFFDKWKGFFNKKYTIYGRSYAHNQDNIVLSRANNPLIGLFHGLINETGADILAQQHFSYLALGHFHDYTKIASKTPCYYSGSPVASLAYKRKLRSVIWIRFSRGKAQTYTNKTLEI